MFKMYWHAGCGIRLETYNCIEGVWLIVPFVGAFLTTLSVDDCMRAFGFPNAK